LVFQRKCLRIGPHPKAQLSAGSRITDYISLGVAAKWFPREKIDAVLAQTGKASRRQRDLPAHVVVDYVIALALFMQVSYREVLRCLLEGLQWLAGPGAPLKVAGNSRPRKLPRFLVLPGDAQPHRADGEDAQTLCTHRELLLTTSTLARSFPAAWSKASTTRPKSS
jgi:hypothetical protein